MAPVDMVLLAPSPEDTRQIGAALAPLLRIHDVVVLTGELGAGKTTLVQGVALGLGAQEHVASPTFTLVREYVSGRLPVAHVDVYRLTRMQEAVDLALDELTGGDGVLLVEWGDAVEDLLADDRLRITLTAEDPTGVSETRRIVLQRHGASWEERADVLQTALERWETAS